MVHFGRQKIVFLLCLVYFLMDARAEAIEVSSNNSMSASSSSSALSSPSSSIPPPSSVSPELSSSIHPSSSSTQSVVNPVTTADICNMSLITSQEDENAIYKKCSCDAQQSNVDCSHLEITELPKLISFPKSVHIANFKGNKISDLNADTFYNGRSILELDFSYNKIDFISITAFTAFKKLTRLDLSHNRVWNLPRGMFQGLGDLRRLDLSFNDLINVFPGHFSQLTELRELIMKNNPLQELEPKHFQHLLKLERLDLESTMLKVIPDHVFVFTPKLKFLNMASNQLTEVPSKALEVLDHLRVLDLSANPIKNILEQAFIGLRGLVILYMDRMSHLLKIENYAFGDMMQLQELHCSYNFMLSDISPHAFVKKSSNDKVPLSQLFLRQNELTTIPKSLLDWNTGLELHLRDNPLHCDCQTDWMINIKLKNNFQTDVRCSTPADLEGVSLNDLKGQQLACGLNLSGIVAIACGIMAGLLILALIVFILIWRRSYVGYTKPHIYATTKKHINDDIGVDDDI